MTTERKQLIPTPAQEFEQVAGKLRWSERSIACARDVLVGGMSEKEAAAKHDMKRAQVGVLKRRFMDKLRVRVSADEYMGEIASLLVFRPELIKLRNAGYSDLLLVDFLSKNGVGVSVEKLVLFLESTGSSKQP